jgi:ATP-dependent exoDNAse (exonuclease V) beta subunit
VGEQAGAQVEVLTVHKAKGLEYPIVIVADLLSDRLPGPDAVVRHATGEAWLKIGGFEPQGWDAARADEQNQQQAEERRLLYVALTRARDHLVIPCFPDQRRKAWLDDAIQGFAIDHREPPHGARATTVRPDGTSGTSEVTWFDTRELDLGGEAAPRTRASAVLDGTDADAQTALSREQAWEVDRKTRRKDARQVSLRVAAASERKAEGDDTKPPVSTPAAAFGRLVHALLAQAPTPEADLTTAAQALAPQYGLTPDDAAAAADLATRARTLPEIAAADTADLVYRELPFAIPMGKDVLATGQIDLAYRHAGTWIVIDFKTAHLHDRAAALEAHGAQLKVYRQALARITGAPVTAALCLLRSGQLLDVGEEVLA